MDKKFISLLLLSFVTVVIGTGSIQILKDDNGECVYTINVQTGTRASAGTDSIIGITIFDQNDNKISIRNIEQWGGQMGPSHDYFENGNLDIFSGVGPCLGSPPCGMILASDGTGHKPGWYVEYVLVVASGSSKVFTVQQWLAVDESPHQLYAIRDGCAKSTSNMAGDEGQRENAKEMLGGNGMTAEHPLILLKKKDIF